MNYSTLADQATIDATIAALTPRSVTGIFVADKAAALQKIKDLIPAEASIMNGASVTLEDIGFVDYLKAGQHGWNNVHEAIIKETDKEKQSALRRSAIADYYLGSVNAMAQTGEFVIGSNTGSQLPHIVFTAKNLIFVVGAQKIVPTLTDALDRVQTYVVPLEEIHMQQKYNAHTTLNKELIFRGENPNSGRTVTVIFVGEKLGF